MFPHNIIINITYNLHSVYGVSFAHVGIGIYYIFKNPHVTHLHKYAYINRNQLKTIQNNIIRMCNIVVVTYFYVGSSCIVY